MDPKTPSFLLAPGPATERSYAPARSERLPAVDDRLVAPESRAEILDGRVYRTMGSNQPHGTRHFEATGLFHGCLADGYEGAVDMLTRADEDSDAAPDLCVFPSGPDPATGGRKLEEIAFEVLDTERMSHVTDKIEKFAARGVRRLFCVRVKARAVYEWSHEHHDWQQLDAAGAIVDRCFRVPIPVRALVDRVVANDTVARSLLAARNGVIERELAGREARGELRGKADGKADGKAEGKAEGLRSAIESVCAVLDIALDDSRRDQVAAMSVEALEALRMALTRQRAWPG